MTPRRTAPVWLIGLSASPFGFYGGIIAFAIPQLLAARHVPEERIAGLTGILILPGVLGFLFAPVLDVRFSRRWYGTVFCFLGACTLAIALMNMADLRVLGALMFVGYSCMALFGAALGGWFASVVPGAEQASLSAWMNVANIGAGGTMAVVSMRVIRHFPLPVAAAMLACMVMLPTVIFLFVPAPGPDRRMAKDSFGGLLRAVLSLFRRREVILVLMLFLLPSSSFALTNILGGLGGDFHTAERTVSLINGVGATIAGALAALLGGPLCKRLPLRQLYLWVGIVGGVFTLSLLLMPHTTVGFGVATLGENAFQALAFTVMTALALRTVGHGNALAATEYSILTSAGNLPIFYMQFVDSHAYTLHKLPGAFMMDAGISIAVCMSLLALLLYLRSRGLLDAKAEGILESAG
jgi:PAT family beta-lactamase induction signal transducer AmpG